MSESSPKGEELSEKVEPYKENGIDRKEIWGEGDKEVALGPLDLPSGRRCGETGHLPAEEKYPEGVRELVAEYVALDRVLKDRKEEEECAEARQEPQLRPDGAEKVAVKRHRRPGAGGYKKQADEKLDEP
jgi:hypothetical protein